MKTSININLFGTLFAIDEDAHQLLKQYLASMKSYFSRQEGGDEIADDIEHRVAELFWELKQQGNQSITIEQVKAIIQEIGNPEDLGGQQAADNSGQTADEQKTDAAADDTTGDTTGARHKGAKEGAEYIGGKAKEWMSQRRYYRDPQDKMVGGVLSGLAHYFGTGDPIVWRVIFVLLTIFVQVFPAVIIYVLLWLCAPEARTPEERLRMQGKEVNPENIKSQVLGYGEAPSGTQQQRQNSGCLGSATGFFAFAFKVLLVLMAIPLLFVIATVLFALFAALFGVIGGLFGAATGITVGGTSLFASLLASEKWAILALILAALAFIALFIYTIYRFFHRDKMPTSGLTYTILLALMIMAGLIGWGSAERLKHTLHDVDWSNVVVGFDHDDDDDWEDYGDAIFCDSTYTVSAFSEVEIQGIGQVIYRKGDSCSVRVNATDYLMKHMIVEDQDGKLLITQDDQLGNKSRIGNLNLKVYVTAPYVTDLKMRGIGSVEIEGNIEQQQPVNVELEGIGKIDIDHVTCPKLHVVNKGAGKVDIEAYVDSLIVSNKGIGAINIEGRTYSYQRNNEGIGAINDKDLKIGM